MKNQSSRAERSGGACLLLILVALAPGCGSDSASTTDSSVQTGSAATARLDGDHPCRGLTPLEAAQRYKGAARRAGASGRFVELVTEPTPAVNASPGYPRLVGAFYASTLPPSKRAAAAAACANELAAE